MQGHIWASPLGFPRQYSFELCIYACVPFVQAAFVLPQTFPVRRETLNYSGVAVGIVMLGIFIFWFLPGGLGARRWYRGDRKTAKIGIDSVR